MNKFLVLATATALLAACNKQEVAPAPVATADATQPADAPAVEMPAEEKTEAKN